MVSIAVRREAAAPVVADLEAVSAEAEATAIPVAGSRAVSAVADKVVAAAVAVLVAQVAAWAVTVNGAEAAVEEVRSSDPCFLLLSDELVI